MQEDVKERMRIRESVMKQGILMIVGMILARIPIGGFYPLGPSYATGVMTSRGARLPVIISMCLVSLFTMNDIDRIKYSLIIATIYIIIRTLEGNTGRMKLWQVATISTVAVVLMEGTDAYMSGWTRQDSYIMVAIGILTASGGYVAEMFVDYVSGEGRKHSVNNEQDTLLYSEMLKNYEERLKMISKAFDKLAKASERTMVNDEAIDTSIENKILRSKLDEYRDLLVMYIKATGNILNNIAADMDCRGKNYKTIKEELEIELKANGVAVREICILEDKGKKQVIVKMANRRSRYITVGNVARVISEIMGKNYVVTSGNKKIVDSRWNTYIFMEDANYILLHGMAKKSMDGKVSGDSFSCMELEGGQTLLSISDGMGTGARANKESEEVIELLEDFMSCGFDETLSLKLINSIFVTRENPHPATVDISIIDMHSGVCDIVKSGAATTYVKREGWVEAIKSTSLPIGIMENVDVETTSKKLYDGDFVIMVSDGLVESIEDENKEDILSSIILSAKSKKPKELAMEILGTVAARIDKDNLDDMTVLVTGVWDKIA